MFFAAIFSPLPLVFTRTASDEFLNSLQRLMETSYCGITSATEQAA